MRKTGRKTGKDECRGDETMMMPATMIATAEVSASAFAALAAAVVIGGTVYGCLRGFMKLDPDHGLIWDCTAVLFLCGASLLAGVSWHQLLAGGRASHAPAWLLLQIYFVVCCVTDYLTCQVYDVLQYLGTGVGAFLVLAREGSLSVGISLIVFALLQYFVFMKLYGKADGMAFLAAAMAEGALGYDLEMFLTHMILAYLLLGLVQWMKGNVGSRGRLKRAVPFMPYITVCFWGILIW